MNTLPRLRRARWVETIFKLFAAFLVFDRASGQTEQKESQRQPDHIFLIDTSLSMSRSRDSAVRQLSSILLSGINGRMQSNDTYAVWTFDTEIHTEFGVHTWNPPAAQTIADEAASFIKSQRFKKQNRFDRVIPKAREQMSLSARGTIAILSDGDSRFSGTPFDAEVNALFQRQGRDARRNKKIFLVLFASQNHELTAWNAGFDASLLDLPLPPPPAPVVVKTNQVPAVAAKEPDLVPVAPKILPSPRETNSISVAAHEPNETKPNISTPPPPLSVTTNQPPVLPANTLPQPAPLPLLTEPPKTEINSKPITVVPATLPVEPDREMADLKSQISNSSQEVARVPQPTPSITEPPKPTPIANEENSKAAPPTEKLTAMANPASGNRTASAYFLIAGVILLGTAAGILMRYYRARSRRGPSLISRSMDR